MDKEILAVKTRKDLYDFVRKNPGFHLRELSRALGLSITLADYHLRFLERHELITSAMDGEYGSSPGPARARRRSAPPSRTGKSGSWPTCDSRSRSV